VVSEVRQKANVLFLEGFGWNEAGQSLIFFSLTMGLPPVGIVLTNYMKNVALGKCYSQLSTGNINVIFGVVVKVRSDVNLKRRLRSGDLLMRLEAKKDTED